MLASTLLLFAAAARAIQITSPANGTVWQSGEVQTIAWNAVDTDPDEFTLAVQIQDPFSTQEIASVQTSDGSYSWTPPASLVGTDYRINFLNSKGDGILAQSGYFDVEQGTAAVSSSARSSASQSASQSAGASRSLSASASAGASNSLSASAAASASGAANIPNAASAAGALVPSLALVAGSLAALLA